jgi:hypothetical protein
MSTTFLAIFIVLLIMVTFWRVTLIAIVAFVLAMVLTGVNGLLGHAEPAGRDVLDVINAPAAEPAENPLFAPPPQSPPR